MISFAGYLAPRPATIGSDRSTFRRRREILAVANEEWRPMAYVFGDVDMLVTTPPKVNVGTGQCVALIEKYTKVGRPAHLFWRQGTTVRGNLLLKKRHRHSHLR